MTADALTGEVLEVSLSGTDFNDHWLRNLNDLPKLKALTLARTSVTDDGLFRIKCWPKLEKLELHGWQYTDKALEKVAQAHSLRSLRLAGTNVSNDGIIALQKALPGLVIIREP